MLLCIYVVITFHTGTQITKKYVLIRKIVPNNNKLKCQDLSHLHSKPHLSSHTCLHVSKCRYADKCKPRCEHEGTCWRKQFNTRSNPESFHQVEVRNTYSSAGGFLFKGWVDRGVVRSLSCVRTVVNMFHNPAETHIGTNWIGTACTRGSLQFITSHSGRQMNVQLLFTPPIVQPTCSSAVRTLSVPRFPQKLIHSPSVIFWIRSHDDDTDFALLKKKTSSAAENLKLSWIQSCYMKQILN